MHAQVNTADPANMPWHIVITSSDGRVTGAPVPATGWDVWSRVAAVWEALPAGWQAEAYPASQQASALLGTAQASPRQVPAAYAYRGAAGEIVGYTAVMG